MKKLFLLIAISIISNASISQNKKNHFFNELSLSFNRPIDSYYEKKPNLGIGISAYHVFFNDKRVNILTGLDYNRTRITHQTDFYYRGQHLHYTINSIGLPLSIRLNFGRRTIFFIESEIFFDFLISTRQEGLVNKYYPIINSYKTVNVNENVNYTKIDYGAKGGFGFKFFIKDFEFLVKSDLNLGLHFVKFDNTEFFNRYFKLSIGVEI